MIYLGGMMSSSGDSGTELNRPLGMARKDFDVLCRIWKHTSISLDRTVKIFDACVVAKLMYCMHIVWFNKAERSKLDAFQARCLRKLAGIPHPYISRISNQVVLNTCGSTPLSSTLTCRQLLLMGKIATMPDDSAIRRSVFISPSLGRPFPVYFSISCVYFSQDDPKMLLEGSRREKMHTSERCQVFG